MTTAAKPSRQSEAAAEIGLPLSAPLRINLSALGIDSLAPDFAERFFCMACENEPTS